MNSKRTVAVVFGGTNTEHEVSLVSAQSVMAHLDRQKFTVIPIYISKANQWLEGKNSPKALPDSTQTISPTDLPHRDIDVIFPVLHGPYGEDGTIQGLLKLLHLPFVGSDVLASAVCMDKVIQKQLCQSQGIPITPFAWIDQPSWQHHPDKFMANLKSELRLPLFVKPANQGSSIGVTKVFSFEALIAAMDQAFNFDTKILIEQGVDHAREIECSLLGNHVPEVSVLGEILPSNEFYDYDAKYIDGKSAAVIPAKLSPRITRKIQQLAIRAFQILNCAGLARADFLVNGQTMEIFLSELNTMPGFTTISMYPQLWEATGLSYAELLEKLIDLAIERHQETDRLAFSYTPKLPWHQKQ